MQDKYRLHLHFSHISYPQLSWSHYQHLGRGALVSAPLCCSSDLEAPTWLWRVLTWLSSKKGEAGPPHSPCYTARSCQLSWCSLFPTDINECLMQGLCKDAKCLNTRGSFRCTCRPGTMLDPSRSHCICKCSRGSRSSVKLQHALCLLCMWEGAHCPHLCAGWVSREPSRVVFVHGCFIASCSCSWCSLEEMCLQGGGDSSGGRDSSGRFPKGRFLLDLEPALRH